jgi:hypothetical protein
LTQSCFPLVKKNAEQRSAFFFLKHLLLLGLAPSLGINPRIATVDYTEGHDAAPGFSGN